MARSKLSIATEQFDNWMTQFSDSHKKTGNLEDHNKALVAYLNGSNGFHLVKTLDAATH